MTILPNPFSSAAGDAAAETSAAALNPPPASDAAADDHHFDSALEAAMPADTAAGPDFTDPPVPAADDFDAIPLAELAARGFDVDAFMIDLEPAPLFLQSPQFAQDLLELRAVLAGH